MVLHGTLTSVFELSLIAHERRAKYQRVLYKMTSVNIVRKTVRTVFATFRL